MTTTTEQSSIEGLLACFFEQSEEQFDFLKSKGGFRVIRGLAEYRGGRRVVLPYKKQPLSSEFWAITCFEKEDVVLEILYGHDNFTLEAYATFNHIDRFMLSEFLEAAKKPDGKLAGEKWIHTPESMTKTLSTIGASLKKNMNYFVSPDPKIIERARSMRSKRMERYIYDQYKKDIKDACQKAARAFRNKNYRQVIELLTPYEEDLSKSDVKKLGLARDNIGDSK